MSAIKNSNELVYLAAAAVIQEPTKYSPMFFYGKADTDKTHLLRSIVRKFKQVHKKPALYTTAQKFLKDHISALRENKKYLFDQKYRSNRLLVVDNIHLLTGKDYTQGELLGILKEFQIKDYLVILSANRHPNLIPALNDILRDSCQGGLILEVKG